MVCVLVLQVTLLSRFNGVGYTFVLAGFLKIVTVGGLSLSAPTDVARTAFGKATPYLMVPVGLGLCWVAKQVGEEALFGARGYCFGPAQQASIHIIGTCQRARPSTMVKTVTDLWGHTATALTCCCGHLCGHVLCCAVLCCVPPGSRHWPE